MSSPDSKPGDESSAQENSPASSRYFPVSRNGILEIPPVDLVAVSRQELQQIHERHKQELLRIREQHKLEFERIETSVRQNLDRLTRRIEAELSPRAGSNWPPRPLFFPWISSRQLASGGNRAFACYRQAQVTGIVA
jgi:hypothetical protein